MKIWIQPTKRVSTNNTDKEDAFIDFVDASTEIKLWGGQDLASSSFFRWLQDGTSPLSQPCQQRVGGVPVRWCSCHCGPNHWPRDIVPLGRISLAAISSLYRGFESFKKPITWNEVFLRLLNQMLQIMKSNGVRCDETFVTIKWGLPIGSEWVETFRCELVEDTRNMDTKHFPFLLLAGSN